MLRRLPRLAPGRREPHAVALSDRPRLWVRRLVEDLDEAPALERVESVVADTEHVSEVRLVEDEVLVDVDERLALSVA